MAQKGAAARVYIKTHQKKGALGGIKLRTTSQKKGALDYARIRATGTFILDAGSNATIEPFTTVTLTAVASKPLTSAQWSQVSTDTWKVTLAAPQADNGVVRTFLSPGTPSGTVLHFTLVGHVEGESDAMDTVAYTVNAHGGLWEKQGTAWIARGTV
jgi:hypothetical protein